MESALHHRIQQLYQLVSNMHFLPHPASSKVTMENMIMAYNQHLRPTQVFDLI